MSYIDKEKSIDDANPVELYKFTMGSDVWLFTSANIEVVYSTETYEPVYIKRDPFTKTSDLAKSTMQIKVAMNNSVAQKFKLGWITSLMMLTVFRHHMDDDEYSVMWKGRIVDCKWSGSEAILTSEAASTILKRAGLRRVFQVNCPHVLFGSACGVSQSSYSVSGLIGSVTAAQLTISSAASYADGYFNGGMLKFGSDYRTIVSHVGSSIVMVDRMEDLVIGSSVTIYPGCSRTLAVCNSRFNNTLNYGGLPYLPEKNPFSGDAIV